MNHIKLYSSHFGSRLYGTSTPASDVDIKNVVLVDLDELLVGRGVKNTFKKTNTLKNVRNTVDDVDEEFIPVQVFARDFLMGQTYAIELAFSIDGNHAEQTFYENGMFSQFVMELRTRFLTSNIKAMMGYVVNQASLYSFKGERLNVVRELSQALKSLKNDTSLKDTIDNLDTEETKQFCETINQLKLKYPKYFRQDTYDIGGGKTARCFYILEKTLPFTNTISHSVDVVGNLEKMYGTRAGKASESNVDWKATMHALRIVDEGLELLKNHKLEFPFNSNYAEYLLSVKRGELPLDPIREELSNKLDLLKDLEKTTTLLPVSELQEQFDTWLKKWMRKFYAV